MKLKPWQVITLIVLGLAAAGWAIVSFAMADTVKLTTVIYCVDVENGDLYRVNTEKYRTIFPARHPTTNHVQLVRVSKDESGGWIVSPRDRGMLSSLDQGVKNNAVDPESGKLLLPAKAPIDYTPPKESP